jgi:hypothetical protein
VGTRAGLVTAAAVVAFAAAGCAQDGSGVAGTPTPPPVGASPTRAPQPTPTDVPLDPIPTHRPSPRPKGTITLPAESKRPPAGATELTGTVTAGVEGGCLLLDGYLLLNPNPRVVREGARVRVTGYVRTDVVTTCQQGTPFMIETAEPA